MSKQTFGTSLLVLGAIVVTIGSQMSLRASAIGQTSDLMWIDQQAVLPAATIESSNPAGVLAFGMLMMLIGFGMHALWNIQKNDESDRTVRVHDADPERSRRIRQKKNPPRTSRKQMEVIWVERTIRL